MFGIRHLIDRFDQLLALLRSYHLELGQIREELEGLHEDQQELLEKIDTLTFSVGSNSPGPVHDDSWNPSDVGSVVRGVDFVAESLNALLIHHGVKPPPTFKSGEQVRCVVTEITDDTNNNAFSTVSFLMPHGEHGILNKRQCISPALYFRTPSSMFHRDQEITVKIRSVNRDGYGFELLDPSPIQDPPPYAPGDITSAIVRGEDRFQGYSMELPNGEQAEFGRESIIFLRDYSQTLNNG